MFTIVKCLSGLRFVSLWESAEVCRQWNDKKLKEDLGKPVDADDVAKKKREIECKSNSASSDPVFTILKLH